MPDSPVYISVKANLVERKADRWKPPNFKPARTSLDRFAASLRRFIDLQAGSAWRDLSTLLPDCSGTLVDVGCGAQPFRGLVSPDTKYIGIDTADAERQFGYKIPDTIYFEGTVWPIENGCADTILCTETLEHVLEPSILLKEANRSLKTGGRLILTVPFAARWHYIPFDYWRYTPSSLNHLLTTNGFGSVAVYSRGNHVTVAAYKNMALCNPLLFPQTSSPVLGFVLRIFGLLLLPFFLIMALIGNWSLTAPYGDDCLGYTAVAVKEAAV